MAEPQPAKSRALRIGRWSEMGAIYVLTTTTANRRPVFADLPSARTCITAMRYQHRLGRVHSLAFVVMPDHLHWMVVLTGSKPLAGVMKEVKQYAALAHNRLLNRRGRVWQPGFYDRRIRDETELVAQARYIVANPVRAGLVRSVKEYPHWDAVWL